jgi:putative Holliday junction resolvase
MPHPRTLMGFDYGRRRIGVAVGQELTASARPLATVASGDWRHIERLLNEWQPAVLVVGVSRHADDTASATTQRTLRFVEALAQRSGLSVHTIDERLSSYEAEQRLWATGVNPQHDKAAVDRLAAAVILESWLQQEPADD